MHIDNQINRVQNSHLNKANPANKPKTSFAETLDAVVQSTGAAEMQRVKQTVDAIPGLRPGVVEDYRSRIQQGRYDVSSCDLADRILASALKSSRY